MQFILTYVNICILTQIYYLSVYKWVEVCINVWTIVYCCKMSFSKVFALAYNVGILSENEGEKSVDSALKWIIHENLLFWNNLTFIREKTAQHLCACISKCENGRVGWTPHFYVFLFIFCFALPIATYYILFGCCSKAN